jgi:hypothetical protein
MDSCTLRNDHQTFSYGGLPAEQVQEFRAIADTLRPLLGSLLLAALQAGRELRARRVNASLQIVNRLEVARRKMFCRAPRPSVMASVEGSFEGH